MNPLILDMSGFLTLRNSKIPYFPYLTLFSSFAWDNVIGSVFLKRRSEPYIVKMELVDCLYLICNIILKLEDIAQIFYPLISTTTFPAWSTSLAVWMACSNSFSGNS